MAETEIEKLVVRITGDSSSYQAAVERTKDATSNLEQHFAEAEKAQERLDKSVENLSKSHIEAAKHAEHHGGVLHRLKEESIEAAKALSTISTGVRV